MIWSTRRRQERVRAQQEAQAAVHVAHLELQAAQRRRPAVKRVAEQLRKAQKENHFAERLRATYGGQSS